MKKNLIESAVNSSEKRKRLMINNKKTELIEELFKNIKTQSLGVLSPKPIVVIQKVQ